MRSIKLIPALAAMATLLALAPTGASARPSGPRHLARSGPCRLHLEVPSAPITAGESVTLFGSLQCPKPEEAAGKQVMVYAQAVGRGSYTLIGSATTETGGAFQLTPPIFTANTVFYAVSEGAKSTHRRVRVALEVTPTPPTPVDGSQLFTGGGRARRAANRVTFAGKIGPADARLAPGAVVALQRENATGNEEWHRIDLGRLNGAGEYSITHTFSVPGDANIRVVVHPRSRLNVPAASTPSSYEISQAQNPALTLESSADPLIFGQAVELKGVVAGAAVNTPLTLLARNRGGAFTPVATGTTGLGGSYKFSQTPLRNTLYQVSSATAKSAVVFEGVKYALTIDPTASTIGVKQPLTFSGTVLPALVGHVVYLERQGSLRLGWHVIDIGTVSAPSSSAQPAPFSIVHSFDAPGTARLRIKIPGDPANQGFAGPAFELNVTPGPASALKPEAPGNSRLPNEGQL